jgi:hypothetical protein
MTGSQTRLPSKLFSILQICFFCIKPIFPLYLQAFFEVQPPIFDQKILPTVRSVLFPTHAIMRPMNAEPLITGHKTEEGTAKYAKYAKNPDPSPKADSGSLVSLISRFKKLLGRGFWSCLCAR